MNQPLRAALALLLCALVPLCSLAQEEPEALALLEPLEGVVETEQGEEILRYALPQVEAVTPADEAVNAHYQGVAQGLSAALSAAPDALDGLASISYEVAHNSGRYLSVVLSTYVLGGASETETIAADTFARDGLYAGQRLTLTQLLGLEPEEDEETSLAGALALELVWQLVERDSENMDRDYLDGLTKEKLSEALNPETDFYLDADGNIVFFIQSGVISGEVAGVLRFPFAPAELLSAAGSADG